jgi:hypothetical protein
MKDYTSISEFERTKPTQTLKKINELLAIIEEERRNHKVRTNVEDSFVRILSIAEEVKKLFKQGE